MAVLKGPDHVFELTNAAYRQLIGDRDVIGKPVREVLPDVAGQGYFELLDNVFRTGKAHVGRRQPLKLNPEAGPETKQTFLDFIYQPIIDSAGTVTGVFVEGTDVTDHVLAESRLQLLNDELKHRVKNTISVVSAIAGQTLRGKGQDAALDAFHARLMAFGRAHDILTATSQTSAPIGEVVKDALHPYRTGGHDHFRISGPEITLGSQQALSLSLALHELATNAAKYGALSRDGGHVDIVWRIEQVSGEPQFQFLWQETGGPAVTQPEKSGFGSQLIRRVLAGDFGGKVEISYEPSGVVCLLTTPQAKCCPPVYTTEDRPGR